MAYILCFSIALYIALVALNIFWKKRYFDSATYICIGICIPLVLYLFKWSELITEGPSWQFCLIFVFLFLGSSVLLMSKRSISLQGTYVIRMKSIAIDCLNVFWLMAALMENYIGTGMFFPALRGIDVHLRQVPLLLYITRAVYAIVAVDIVCYFLKGKKKYLIWVGLHLLLPIISASSRMMSVVTAVQGASLFLFLWMNGYGIKKAKAVSRRKQRKLRWYHIVTILILAGCAVYYLVNVGIKRMNHYGLYALLYSNGIKYTGPLGEIGAWLYGYFALSFDNLNESIIRGMESPNLLGLYSFPSLYFGLLQFDNIFGLISDLPQKVCASKVSAALVPTGFWNFYYDFGILFFIPLCIAFTVEYYIKRKTRTSKRKLEWVAIYFYFVPQWCFMSFTNTIFDVTAISTVIITYLAIHALVKKYRT